MSDIRYGVYLGLWIPSHIQTDSSLFNRFVFEKYVPLTSVDICSFVHFCCNHCMLKSIDAFVITFGGRTKFDMRWYMNHTFFNPRFTSINLVCHVLMWIVRWSDYFIVSHCLLIFAVILSVHLYDEGTPAVQPNITGSVIYCGYGQGAVSSPGYLGKHQVRRCCDLSGRSINERDRWCIYWFSIVEG